MIQRVIRAAALLGAAVFLCGAGPIKIPSSARADAAIARQTPSLQKAMETKGVALGAPIFLRIIKTEDGRSRDGYLEAFAAGGDGSFIFVKTWDVCTWSGALGPKLKQGDGQSPEGFYFVKPKQLNPLSSYHLSFNLGYPNAYDRAHGRTGDFLMVHGNCVSIGCYAMTDTGIEEIYTVMQAAFQGGQPFVRVHIFPFPMTDDIMALHAGTENAAFWQNLKQGWDFFEQNDRPPNVTVRAGAYVFAPE